MCSCGCARTGVRGTSGRWCTPSGGGIPRRRGGRAKTDASESYRKVRRVAQRNTAHFLTRTETLGGCRVTNDHSARAVPRQLSARSRGEFLVTRERPVLVTRERARRRPRRERAVDPNRREPAGRGDDRVQRTNLPIPILERHLPVRPRLTSVFRLVVFHFSPLVFLLCHSVDVFARARELERSLRVPQRDGVRGANELRFPHGSLVRFTRHVA